MNNPPPSRDERGRWVPYTPLPLIAMIHQTINDLGNAEDERKESL